MTDDQKLESLKKQLENWRETHTRKFSSNVNEGLYQESVAKGRELHRQIGVLDPNWPIWF